MIDNDDDDDGGFNTTVINRYTKDIREQTSCHARQYLQ